MYTQTYLISEMRGRAHVYARVKGMCTPEWVICDITVCMYSWKDCAKIFVCSRYTWYDSLNSCIKNGVRSTSSRAVQKASILRQESHNSQNRSERLQVTRQNLQYLDQNHRYYVALVVASSMACDVKGTCWSVLQGSYFVADPYILSCVCVCMCVSTLFFSFFLSFSLSLALFLSRRLSLSLSPPAPLALSLQVCTCARVHVHTQRSYFGPYQPSR